MAHIEAKLQDGKARVYLSCCLYDRGLGISWPVEPLTALEDYQDRVNSVLERNPDMTPRQAEWVALEDWLLDVAGAEDLSGCHAGRQAPDYRVGTEYVFGPQPE